MWKDSWILCFATGPAAPRYPATGQTAAAAAAAVVGGEAATLLRYLSFWSSVFFHLSLFIISFFVARSSFSSSSSSNIHITLTSCHPSPPFHLSITLSVTEAIFSHCGRRVTAAASLPVSLAPCTSSRCVTPSTSRWRWLLLSQPLQWLRVMNKREMEGRGRER